MWSGEPNIVNCGTIIQLCTGNWETSTSRQRLAVIDTIHEHFGKRLTMWWAAVPITCLLLFHFETWRVISAASSTNLVPSATCHLVLCPRTDSLNFNLWLLKNLKPSKSPGPDQIRPSELKMVAKEIAWSVSILFNETLVTGELPQEFKMGNIVPLLKPGKTNTALPSNYRGITLTCIFSKVLERIVYDQITTYLRERNILSESQYGFRTGHSCADLLTVAIDDWLLAQDSKMHTAIIFIDLSKAFDNVQHQLLLLKLQQHGIGGSALAWLVLELPVSTLPKCYAQWLIIRVLLLIKGVPQGSVLGPLLFNIYVAGLPSIAEQHNASLPSFADDMSLYCSRKTEEEACRDASQALDAISLSLQEIGLTMNTDKTTAMVVNPRRKTQSMASQTAGGSIYCQGRQVAIVSCSRVLGVIIDNNLTWSAHVDPVHSKVARKIGALRHWGGHHGSWPGKLEDHSSWQ